MRKDLKEALKAERKKGFLEGVKFMTQKMLSVCDTDKPIEIESQGAKRAYFVQSDVKHLHKLFNDIEANHI